MRKILILFVWTCLSISCNELSKEEILIHNQKVTSGIQSKKRDLDEMLKRIDEQHNFVASKYKDVSSFKLFRSESKKRKQLKELNELSKELINSEKRIKSLRKELDLLHKTFDFQKKPKIVLERLFNSAKYQRYENLLWLADPYDENDRDVDRITYVQSYSRKEQLNFTKEFSKGRIIGEPKINGETAEIEFLYGPNAKKKETMKLIKRNKSWYLLSY